MPRVTGWSFPCCCPPCPDCHLLSPTCPNPTQPSSPDSRLTTSRKLSVLDSKPNCIFLFWKKPWESRPQCSILSSFLLSPRSSHSPIGHLSSLPNLMIFKGFPTHYLSLFKMMSNSRMVLWLEPRTHREADSWAICLDSESSGQTDRGPAVSPKCISCALFPIPTPFPGWPP